MRRPSISSLWSSEGSACGDDTFRDVDKARRKVLHTQACDGTWHLLLSVAPSVIPYVLQSVDFWLSVLVYVSARMILVFEIVEPTELGHFRGLATMGFLLALLLSFYVNISVTRLFETNKDAMTLIREVNDVSLLMRGYIWKTEEQRDLARRCVDYMCAAMVHGFIGFTRPYTAENLWVGYNDEFGVVTPQENALIMRHREVGGSRMRECLAWTMQGVAMAESKNWIAAPIATELNASITKFLDSVQALYDFRYLPIPFVLEHLLVFFIHIYLPIQTFEMAVQTSILAAATSDSGTLIVIEAFGCLLALLANIGFQGLFAVGAFLEEPYGEGICHARVSSFCRMSVKEARRVLDSGNPWSLTPPNQETQAKVDAFNEILSQRGIENTKPALGLRVLQYLVDLELQKSPDLLLSPPDISQSLQSYSKEDDKVDTEVLFGVAMEAAGEYHQPPLVQHQPPPLVQSHASAQAKADLVSALRHLTSVLTSVMDSSSVSNGNRGKHRPFGPRLGDKLDMFDKLCTPDKLLCTPGIALDKATAHSTAYTSDNSSQTSGQGGRSLSSSKVAMLESAPSKWHQQLQNQTETVHNDS